MLRVRVQVWIWSLLWMSRRSSRVRLRLRCFFVYFRFGELANLQMEMKTVTLDTDTFALVFRLRWIGRGDFSVYPDPTGPPVGWQPWLPLLDLRKQGARIKHESLLVSRASMSTSTDDANGTFAVWTGTLIAAKSDTDTIW